MMRSDLLWAWTDDLLPTLLGLARISQEPIRQTFARDRSDALPLVGCNPSPLILGQVNPASVKVPGQPTCS